MALLQKRSKKTIGAESNEQGRAFEEAFCAFMKSDLGYSDAKTRGDVHSYINSKGIQVDVIAQKSSYWSDFFFVMCLLGVIASAGLSVLAFNKDNDSYLYVASASAACLAGLFFYLMGATDKEHAWVECKSSKDKTSLEEVQTMMNRFEAYLETENKKFEFTEKYFVSASGYIDDAYHYAKSKGIVCYIEKNSKFVEATYWNI